MTRSIEFRVLELLCSRLCHELISPVSAINNGMELLADDDGGMAEDIRDLLASSARNASLRLQFYRVAYGLGGDASAPLPIETASSLTAEIASDGKVALTWAPPREFPELSRGAVKSLINLVVLGLEALPRGGNLTVAPGTGQEVVMTATGRGARVTDESKAALSDDADVVLLTARTVHAYFTRALVDQAGGTLAVDTADERVTFRVRFAG